MPAGKNQKNICRPKPLISGAKMSGAKFCTSGKIGKKDMLPKNRRGFGVRLNAIVRLAFSFDEQPYIQLLLALTIRIVIHRISLRNDQ